MTLMKTLLFSLIALCLISATQAARFEITNRCPYTVWPAATPSGGGTQLNSGVAWNLDVPAGTQSAVIWGRTGCNFDSGRGGCQTGDCGGALSCQSSGQPPLTLAEFTLNEGGNNLDLYDISVIDGFNIPMEFSPTSNGCTRRLVCTSSSCPDAYQPNDVRTISSCPGGTDYKVVFCP